VNQPINALFQTRNGGTEVYMIKFGLFSDLHYSLPGTEQRGNSSRAFEDSMKGMARFASEKADFAVSLGDNIQPAENAAGQYAQLKNMLTAWSKYGIPVHLSHGNHDFQQLSLSDVMEIQQTDRTYHGFDLRGIRFLMGRQHLLRAGSPDRQSQSPYLLVLAARQYRRRFQ
jgi:predicted phosphodiesterase